MLLTILQGTGQPSQRFIWPKVSVMPLEHSGIWETSRHSAFFKFLLLLFRGTQFTHLLGFTLEKAKPSVPFCKLLIIRKWKGQAWQEDHPWSHGGTLSW